MARVVLVHGIGQQASSTEEQLTRWVPSLVKGVLLSGHPRAGAVAGELAGGAAAAMAFYGDLFFRRGVQGGEPTLHEMDDEVQAVTEELARAVLEAAVARGDARTVDEARQALHQADPELAGVMGPGAVVRGAVRALDDQRWLAARIFRMAQRATPDLVQVARYLAEPSLQEAVQGRVAGLVDEQTRVVVGHSLGSVVAWEACHRATRSLPLLVTLGSPLGLDTVVLPRLRPQPPAWPPHVRRWVNVAHDDDFIAVEQRLAPLFPADDGRLVEDHPRESDRDHHGITGYLERPETGLAIAAALDMG